MVLGMGRQQIPGRRRNSRRIPAHWLSWWRRDPRLPLVARLPLLIAVVGLTMQLIGAVSTNYHDVIAYRRAPMCPDGPVGAQHCIAPDSGEVRDRHTGQVCTSDTEHHTDCSTYYVVALHRIRGEEWLDVAASTYHDVKKGDRADLLTWHGAVVRMVVAGHTETYGPPSEHAIVCPLGGLWLALGLAVWLVVSGRPRHLFAFGNFGVVWLATPVALLVQGLLLGSSWPEFGILILFIGFGIGWTLVVWQLTGGPRLLLRLRW
jgi:hypothetical protein